MEKALLVSFILFSFFFQISSLDNVTINESVVIDVNYFFGASFAISTPSARKPSKPFALSANQFTDYRHIANKYLDTKYSVLGNFFDLKVGNITMFVPDIDEFHNQLANFSGYRDVFSKYVVPCRLTWNHMLKLQNGTQLPTFLKGFNVNITKVGEAVMVNEVIVRYPEAYYNGRVVVHGIEKMFKNHSDSSGSHGKGWPRHPSDKHKWWAILIAVILLEMVLFGVGALILVSRDRIMVRQVQKIAILTALLVLEVIALLCDFWFRNFKFLRLLPIPFSLIILYLTLLLDHLDPNHYSAIPKIFDIPVIVLLAHCSAYGGVLKLVNVEVPGWFEKVVAWFAGISILLRNGEAINCLGEILGR